MADQPLLGAGQGGPDEGAREAGELEATGGAVATGRGGAEGNDVPQHVGMDQLLRRLEQLEALREENQILRERLAAQDLRTPVTVHVKAPTPPPRLGIFTGLKPTGGSELQYHDWEERVRQYVTETGDCDETLRRVRSSLRGVTIEQVKGCTTATAVLDTLQTIYGSVSTPDDLFAKFVRTQMDKCESAHDFFSRVWASFAELNKDGAFGTEAANRKVYHTFMSNQCADRLLIMELRSEFGMPGAASPDPSKVLRRLRELGGGASSMPKGQARAAQTSVEIDYDKLATLVAQKMANNSISSDQPTRPRQQPPAPRGPCYRCGEVGTHFRRDCKNAANPARVAQAKKDFLQSRRSLNY